MSAQALPFLHDCTAHDSGGCFNVSEEILPSLQYGAQLCVDYSPDTNTSSTSDHELQPRSETFAEIDGFGQPDVLTTRVPRVRIVAVAGHAVFFFFGITHTGQQFITISKLYLVNYHRSFSLLMDAIRSASNTGYVRHISMATPVPLARMSLTFLDNARFLLANRGRTVLSIINYYPEISEA